MRVKTIQIEALVAMFVIAMGQESGEGFTYIPKLPSCFSNGIKSGFGYFNANFSHLHVDTELCVECWFMSDSDGVFSHSLNDVKKIAPYLWVAIITHVCDMIENIEI